MQLHTVCSLTGLLHFSLTDHVLTCLLLVVFALVVGAGLVTQRLRIISGAVVRQFEAKHLCLYVCNSHRKPVLRLRKRRDVHVILMMLVFPQVFLY